MNNIIVQIVLFLFILFALVLTGAIAFLGHKAYKNILESGKEKRSDGSNMGDRL